MRIIGKLAGCSCAEDRAFKEKVCPVGDGKCFMNIMVGDKNTDVLFFQPWNDILDIFNSYRVYTGKRFIKRFTLPNSEVLIHQVMGGTEGQASDIAINAKHILRSKDTLNKILSQNTGKKIDQVEKDSDRDYWMTSDEAKKYGIVDDIISKPKSGK